MNVIIMKWGDCICSANFDDSSQILAGSTNCTSEKILIIGWGCQFFPGPPKTFSLGRFGYCFFLRAIRGLHILTVDLSSPP
jgi:hypothetical protein